MFAPVKTLRELTFSVVMLADATLSVRIFELTMFSKLTTERLEMLAIAMFAILVTES